MAQETTGMNNTVATGRRRSSSQPESDNHLGGGGTPQQQQHQQQRHHHHYKDSLKIFVSRIPVHFDEDSIRRLVQEQLQESPATTPTTTTSPAVSNDNDKDVGTSDSDVVLAVELAYPIQKESSDEKHQDDEASSNRKKNNKPHENNVEQQQHHKGYGFVVLKDTMLVQMALTLGKLRGGAKPTSTRQNYTLYIGPCLTDAEKEASKNNNKKISHGNQSNSSNKKQPCFLWTSSGNKHCRYGAACKFQHVGGSDDSTTTNNTRDSADDDDEKKNKKKRIKCRDHRKGKCKLGADKCPFSHDFEPKKKSKNDNDDDDDVDNTEPAKKKKDDSEKDCISWKTKGKCRKFQRTTTVDGMEAKSTLSSSSCCPYRHDPDIQKAALDKRKKKKRQQEHADNNAKTTTTNGSKRQRREQQQEEASNTKKIKQPLCVRVFGMSYETTLDDVQRAFAPCGKITKIDFPVFDDASRRSKGYCCVTFCTPKAVEKAICELDGHCEKERWWRVQAGHMLLDQWE